MLTEIAAMEKLQDHLPEMSAKHVQRSCVMVPSIEAKVLAGLTESLECPGNLIRVHKRHGSDQMTGNGRTLKWKSSWNYEVLRRGIRKLTVTFRDTRT